METKFVAYKDKSSAKRGFERATKGQTLDVGQYLAEQEGQWGFFKNAETGDIVRHQLVYVEKRAAEGRAPAGMANEDPVQGILVDAMRDALTKAQALGVPGVDHDNAEAMIAREGEQGAAAAIEEDETPAPSASAFGNFLMNQLGNIGPNPAASAAPRPPVLTKIEKNRDERNGVKRPSAGTLCAQVWDLAWSLSELNESGNEHSKIATLSQVIKAAEARGINKFTARTQYARWRVFHGITGRLS